MKFIQEQPWVDYCATTGPGGQIGNNFKKYNQRLDQDQGKHMHNKTSRRLGPSKTQQGETKTKGFAGYESAHPPSLTKVME